MDYSCIKTIDCQQGAVRAVRFNVDGSYCLTSGADRKVKLWNPHRGLLLKTYGGHGDEVLDARGSSDSSQIVSCGADKSVILWDVSTGQPMRRLRGHATRVTCVCFNELSTVAVSGSQDNTVMFWDARSRKSEPIQVLKHAKDSVTSVQVTDHEVLVGSLDCRLRRYDIRSGELFTDFVGEPVMCASLTRDGQCMLAGCSDGNLRLLDKDTGELLGSYTGHQVGDYRVESCVDQSDKHVLSGASDGCVWCWDLVTESVVNKLSHGGTVVGTLSPHPTKPFLLSAAGLTIKLWGKEPLDEEAI
ncbi:WD repeat domain-containing protein 83-like [Bacillus rossius redtenbacheri]|uniref:WD repeat domain-containing protein 83-like n=1 Tax=Bacillus rossius redtenbacheri TaxID=93214 RepID=UPI002FDC8745